MDSGRGPGRGEEAASPLSIDEIQKQHLRNVRTLRSVQSAILEAISGLETVLPLANRRDINTPIMWPGMSSDDLSNISNRLEDTLDELRAIQIEMKQTIRLVVYRYANAMSSNWQKVRTPFSTPWSTTPTKRPCLWTKGKSGSAQTTRPRYHPTSHQVLVQLTQCRLYPSCPDPIFS